MAAFDGRRVFVHCSANMRVSAFTFLYQVLCERVGVAEAARDLYAIWTPNEVWDRFIRNQLERADKELPIAFQSQALSFV